MKRAKACFINVDLAVTPYATGKLTGKRRWDFEHLLIPQLTSFERWKIVLHEKVGYFIYRIMGYI
jgi:hypothetical protein